MFSACVNKCYVLHVIYQLSSLDCILKTGESRRNHCAYAVTRAGGGGGCSGVSDPACPGTTMVSRRWVTSTIAQPRICRPRFQHWRAAASMAGRCTSTANCQHAASKLGRSTSSQWPLLFIPCVLSCRKILSWSFWSFLYPAGRRFRICPLLAGHVPCTTFIFYFNVMVTV